MAFACQTFSPLTKCSHAVAWYSNGGLNNELFEYRTSKSLLFRSFGNLNVQYLNPHCNIRTFKITIFSFKT